MLRGLQPMGQINEDRRLAKRRILRIPIQIYALDNRAAKFRAQSVNISESGALVEADYPLRAGVVLDLQLKLPQEFGGQTTMEWRCKARVVHVASRATAEGLHRAGVSFDGWSRSRG